jgi:ABC-2 type transport system permease protein
MSARRSWQILRKDLRLGPRSPVLLWALVVPVVITLLVRGVFGGLFADEPRLGIVDEGTSALVDAAQARAGLDVRVLDEREALRAEVEDGGLDAGVVLPAGFDAAVRAGEQPPVTLWLAGDSLPADRAVLLATVLDLARGLADTEAPVTVDVVELGEPTLPLDLRLLPLIVMYAVAIPGGMVPAMSLVEEKEHGTLHALLASPASVGEVLLAKGLLGVVLALLAGIVTLALNDAFGAQPVAVLLGVVIGAVMMAMIGLMLGAWARDTNTLFAAWKGGGVLLFLPAVFFIWPGLPTWPAYFMPTYYFLRPVYAVSVEGATFGAVWWQLAVAAAVCLVLVPAVAGVGRWLERRLAAGRAEAIAEPVPADA